MKVTSMSAQVRNPDRVNISIDGAYRLSLTITQVVDLSIKVGQEIDEALLQRLEAESTFGKVYQRALEYCLVRPRSQHEVEDYLYRKTRSTLVRNRKTGEVTRREGVDVSVTTRVLQELIAGGYVDDAVFAGFWARHRFVKKGVSRQRLRMELMKKGVASSIIDTVLTESERNDEDELQKVIEKKARRYDSEEKLIQYLMRQGFRYDDIRAALAKED